MKKFHFKIFIVLILILSVRQAIAESTEAAPMLPAVESYEELVSAIRQAKAESRQRIESLVEAEKVREAWEIGKLIDAHVLQHKERADYDKQVIQRLAQDLDSSQTELSFMLQFSRAYPNHSPANKLSWSHYRELLSLNDPDEREELAKQAERQNWGRDRLREEVRKRQAVKKPTKESQAPLSAVPGTPGMYRVVKANYGNHPNELVLDLGFSNYLSLDNLLSRRWPQESRKGRRGATPFKEGDIVKWNVGVRSPRLGEEPSPLQKIPNATDADLFTYSANVIKVIDGDTFTAVIYFGFGFTTVQKLRLRSLDAPEIESAEGREAKEFLEKIMPQGSSVLIRTRRSDKYDRYLADVWVEGKYSSARNDQVSAVSTRRLPSSPVLQYQNKGFGADSTQLTKAEYVNQKLVEQGFAVSLSEVDN